MKKNDLAHKQISSPKFILLAEVVEKFNSPKNSILQRAIEGKFSIYGIPMMLGLPRATELTPRNLKKAISKHLDAGWNGELMLDGDGDEEWPKDLIPVTCPKCFPIKLHTTILEKFLDESEDYVFDNIPISVGDLRAGASNPPKNLPKDDSEYVTFRLNSRAVLRENSLRIDSCSLATLSEEMDISPTIHSTIHPEIPDFKMGSTLLHKIRENDELNDVLIKICKGIECSVIDRVWHEIGREMDRKNRKYDHEEILLQWESRSDGTKNLVWRGEGKEKSIKKPTIENRLSKLRKKKVIS